MKKFLSLFLSVLFIIGVMPVNTFADDVYDIYDNTNINHTVIHDPSIVKSNDGGYYIVGSHIAMAKSDDMINWQDLGYSIDSGETYFAHPWKEELAEPIKWTSMYQEALPDKYTDDSFEYNCWANDIIYNDTLGKYCLYGCCSVWGTTCSVIWLCVSDNIEGPYEYVDSIVYSGITNARFQNTVADKNPVIMALDYHGSNFERTVIAPGYITEDIMNSKARYDWKKQNTLGSYFYTDGGYVCGGGMYPNAIDPTAFVDKDGEYWLVYGSFSGGCFVQKLDKNTGLPDYKYMSEHKSDGYDVYFGKQISKTNAETEGTGEGPFIIYDSVSGYYYFFLTYGGLGGEGGYNIREYRSKNPDGPYVDACGYDATDEKNTGLKLDGGYQFECQPSALISGGHSSCLIDDDGSIYQAYHTRYAIDGGQGFKTVIHKMVRTSDGWAVLLPYEYKGEKQDESVSVSDVVGTYQLVDSTNMTQRLETWDTPHSTIVVPTQYVTLNSDGSITGAGDYAFSITNTNTGYTPVSGSWSIENGTCNATIKLGSVVYKGSFCKQKEDTAAEKEVMTFAGAGSDNSTIMMAEHNQHTFADYRIEPQIGVNGEYGSRCSKCLMNNPAVQKNIIPAIKAPETTKTPETTTAASESQPTAKPVEKTTAKKTTSSKPKAASISKLKAGKKQFKATWKKVSGVTGYQIQYSTSKKFTKKTTKTIKVKGAKKTSTTVKKLKSKKKYYVRIRTYKGSKYSSWSKTKTIKVK